MGIRTDTPEFDHCETWIRNDVRYFVVQGYDFGLAYAAARVGWRHFNEPAFNISWHRAQWLRDANALNDQRRNLIYEDITGQEMIRFPYEVMPRRIWDLKSSRVVEFLMLHSELVATHAMSNFEIQLAKQGAGPLPLLDPHPTYWAITHSWTSSMESVESSINQYQWKVPLPRGLDIESDLRPELLNYGIIYIWLDVLCLRQHESTSQSASISQDIKKNEWKLDVPAIGNIYRKALGIIRYFNGIGMPFSVKGWDDSRHWLRRAWTLQEITTENSTINGGIPRDPTNSRQNIIRNTTPR